MNEDPFNLWKSDPSNRENLGKWMNSIYRFLFSYAYRITNGDIDLSEDLLQESLISFLSIKAYEFINTDQGGIAYLKKSIYMKYIDSIRRKKKEVSEDILYEIPDESTPESIAEISDFIRDIANSLSKADRKILQMIVAGNTVSEIAKENDITYSNAGTKIHRIRSIFK